ncbi:hypothetical protein BJX65DRAFT_315109 [Aspergillus insuetus]
MDQFGDDELEQLLQSLDNIPPGILPQDGVYPFVFPDSTSFLDLPNIQDGCSNANTEYLEHKVQGLEQQVKSLVDLMKDMREYLSGFQKWAEQVSDVIRENFGETIDPAKA